MEENIRPLTTALQLRQILGRLGITSGQVWREYFLLGGDAGFLELEAHLHGCLSLPGHEQNLLARAAERILSRPPVPRSSPPRPGLSRIWALTTMQSQGAGPAPPSSERTDG